MTSKTPTPIALQIKTLHQTKMGFLLADKVSLEVEDNMYMLKLSDATIRVKVPPKCIDQIRVVIQQFRVYQRTAREIMKLPKADRVDETLQFYLSLVSYFKDVIVAFHREAKDDASSSTSKWRSAHLDYHFALALHDSSFTEETQATALKAMKRTWTHFWEKKAFKDVQQLTAKRMHDSFCSGGDDMCGGSFQHILSDDDSMSVVIKKLTGDGSVQPKNNESERVAGSMDSQDDPITTKKRSTISETSSQIVVDDAVTELSSSSRMTRSKSIASKKISSQISANDSLSASSLQKRSMSTSSKQALSQIDADAGDSASSQQKTSKSSSNKVKQGGRQQKSVAVKGGKHTKLQSPTDEIASMFESNANSKRTQKDKKQTRKTRSSKALGKQKAASPPMVESEDHGEEASAVYPSVEPEVEEDNDMDWKESAADVHQYDEVLLPSVQDGWKEWTKILFEDGNSHIFLRLATWMLIRFRQLTNIDMNAPIDGIVIPQNPRLMDDVGDDHFFEALGLERLYSAIVHMETSPRYMSHIFHALGKVLASSDVSASNPRLIPCNSPPTVEARMMSDLDIPWLTLKDHDAIPVSAALNDPTDEDADGSLEGDDVDVREALDSMVIDEVSASVTPRTAISDSLFAKRKRTLSQASPPKNDGGRGPPKRRKDGWPHTVRSISPIASVTDIQESGLISSPLVPTLPLSANSGSPIHDTSVLLDAWDEEMANDIQDLG
ncbi:uncharacterized protein F5147DRAFT_661883, partial [Suillus discolor]